MAGKQKTASRPRRGAKRGRDELILDALEKLLAKTPLRDLNVEEIAQQAGITRTRFYYYFKSKYEAYAALLQRISAEVIEVYNLPDSWWVRPVDARPRTSLESSLRRVLEVWFHHGVVLREASDMWNALPEVRTHWQEVIGRLVVATTKAIDRERERGIAPPGPDSEQLAASLIWQGERLLFLSLIDAPKSMVIDDHVQLGTVLWLRTIYLDDDPDPL
jgi:AcrR family transcriptional regulator